MLHVYAASGGADGRLVPPVVLGAAPCESEVTVNEDADALVVEVAKDARAEATSTTKSQLFVSLYAAGSISLSEAYILSGFALPPAFLSRFTRRKDFLPGGNDASTKIL